MSKPTDAIPTVYRGVQMRSRAEADTARLLDMLKLPWQYEATSVLLPDGRHYRPDFLIPPPHPLRKPTWIEVRGYEHGDSMRQISAVARAVASGAVPCESFAAITAETWVGQRAGFFAGALDHVFYAACESEWYVAVCAECGLGRLTMRSLNMWPSCHQCHNPDYAEACVAIVDGYVSVRNPDSWNPQSATRVRDIVAGANMVTLFNSLPMDYVGEGN